jgi:hypothetical protein
MIIARELLNRYLLRKQKVLRRTSAWQQEVAYGQDLKATHDRKVIWSQELTLMFFKILVNPEFVLGLSIHPPVN